MPGKYLEIAGHAVHLTHVPPTTLPDQPPRLERGRPILFLHGAGSTGAVWTRQLAHFGGRQSPMAIDWPGHGRSSGTEALASVSEYADVTLGVLDRLGLRRAVVAGTSMGGVVALDMALRAPERVAALILMSTAACVTLPAGMAETWRNVMNGRAPQPFTPFGYGDAPSNEILREGWQLQVLTDPRVRHGDLLVAERADFRARLGEIRCPVLVIHGAKDPIIGASCGRELASGIVGARHVEIEGAGHYLYRESPDALHAAIDAFLEVLA